MRILIIKFRNIGDVLLVTPLIKNLKLNYPDALIDVALNKGTEEMVTLNPNVNEIIIYDRDKIKKKKGIKRIFEEIKFGLNIRKKRYDIVINTTSGDRGAILSLISRAKIKIGYNTSKNLLLRNIFNHSLPEQEFRHTIETNLDALRVLNLPVKEKKVEIFWGKKEDNYLDKLELPKEFVHIHPVSRWLFKCLDDKLVAKIIDHCEINLGKKVILTSANIKQELDKISSIISLCSSNPINLGGKLTLKQTAALNKRAGYFIGVDTAIMHISAANDTPVLAFFGPSGADHWGPWDNNLMQSGYTTRRGIRKMGKHTVYQKDWECVPCGKDGCNGTKISDCLMEIKMNEIEALVRWIEK